MNQLKFPCCPTADGNLQAEAKQPTSSEELVAGFMYHEKAGLNGQDVLTLGVCESMT